MAVRGHEDDKGVFIVKDYCFKELSIPKALPLSNDDKSATSPMFTSFDPFLPMTFRYVLFASGFLLSETSVIFNQLEYLVNALTQRTTTHAKAVRNIFSNVVRFVVAGNLIESSNRLKETTNQVSFVSHICFSSLTSRLGEIFNTQNGREQRGSDAQH